MLMVFRSFGVIECYNLEPLHGLTCCRHRVGYPLFLPLSDGDAMLEIQNPTPSVHQTPYYCYGKVGRLERGSVDSYGAS